MPSSARRLSAVSRARKYSPCRADPSFCSTRFMAITERLRLPPLGAGGADFCAFLLKQLGKDCKARTAKLVAKHLHLIRAVSAGRGLSEAIPQRRVFIGDLRPFLIHDFATELFSKMPVSTGLDGCSKHVLLFNKGTSRRSKLVEIGRAAGRHRGSSVTKARRDLKNTCQKPGDPSNSCLETGAGPVDSA